MLGHSWSGWPGAWCLDCGIKDQVEICINECPEAFSADITEDNPYGWQRHCVNPPCSEPGSNRHNPYWRNEDGEG